MIKVALKRERERERRERERRGEERGVLPLALSFSE